MNSTSGVHGEMKPSETGNTKMEPSETGNTKMEPSETGNTKMELAAVCEDHETEEANIKRRNTLPFANTEKANKRPVWLSCYQRRLTQQKREPGKSLPAFMFRAPKRVQKTSNDPRDWSKWVDDESQGNPDDARPLWLREAFVSLRLVDKPVWLEHAQHRWEKRGDKYKTKSRWSYELAAWRRYLHQQLGEKEAKAVLWVQSNMDPAYSSGEDESGKQEENDTSPFIRRTQRSKLGKEQIEELYQPGKPHA